MTLNIYHHVQPSRMVLLTGGQAITYLTWRLFLQSRFMPPKIYLKLMTNSLPRTVATFSRVESLTLSA